MVIGGEGGSPNTYISPTRTQMWSPWLDGAHRRVSTRSGTVLGGWRASSASLLELVEGGRGREMCCRLSPTTMVQKSS
jgi:hypothetical protein